jgi:hypothetical protein
MLSPLLADSLYYANTSPLNALCVCGGQVTLELSMKPSSLCFKTTDVIISYGLASIQQAIHRALHRSLHRPRSILEKVSSLERGKEELYGPR